MPYSESHQIIVIMCVVSDVKTLPSANLELSHKTNYNFSLRTAHQQQQHHTNHSTGQYCGDYKTLQSQINNIKILIFNIK
jgi:hypothetical protein